MLKHCFITNISSVYLNLKINELVLRGLVVSQYSVFLPYRIQTDYMYMQLCNIYIDYLQCCFYLPT